MQWLARLIGSSDLENLGATREGLHTALRLPTLDAPLGRIASLTGSCARLFAVLSLDSGPLTVQMASGGLVPGTQALCEVALKLDTAGLHPVCQVRAAEVTVAGASASDKHDCPVARGALTTFPITTPHPRITLVVVTGLLHPADVYTADVLARELHVDEERAQGLAARLPVAVAGWQRTEDFVAQLASAVGAVAVAALEQRGAFTSDGLDAGPFDLIAENARLANALDRAHSELALQRHHLAVLVHDMRTPLSAVLGHVELLQLGIHGPLEERQQQALQGIHHRTRHVLEMVGDILDYARARNRQVRPSLSRFVLGDVAQRAATAVQLDIGRKGLELRLRFEDDTRALEVVSAELRLEQILVNLLGNAVKFTDQGAVTLILSHPTPRWFEVAVEDTGVGVPASEQEVIFMPYRRASTGRDRQGAGLGLALCRAIVEGLGGTLRLQSEPGRGSTFTVRLPIDGAGYLSNG